MLRISILRYFFANINTSPCSLALLFYVFLVYNYFLPAQDTGQSEASNNGGNSIIVQKLQDLQAANNFKGKQFQQLEISSDVKITDSLLSFEVSKGWMSENNLDETQVVLYHNEGGL